VQRWVQSDARLLRQLLRDLRLPEYLGLRDPSVRLTPLERRQALFQKATIAARKNLWDIAFPSLAAALAADAKSPLSPPDLAALQNMLGCRYGIDEIIFGPAKQAALVKAAGRGPLAREIRCAVGSRLTFWIGQAFRQGDFRRFSATCGALARISGLGALRVFLASLEKRKVQLFRASEADGRRDEGGSPALSASLQGPS
jgi:hypothetical protein